MSKWNVYSSSVTYCSLNSFAPFTPCHPLYSMHATSLHSATLKHPSCFSLDSGTGVWTSSSKTARSNQDWRLNPSSGGGEWCSGKRARWLSEAGVMLQAVPLLRLQCCIVTFRKASRGPLGVHVARFYSIDKGSTFVWITTAKTNGSRWSHLHRFAGLSFETPRIFSILRIS